MEDDGAFWSELRQSQPQPPQPQQQNHAQQQQKPQQTPTTTLNGQQKPHLFSPTLVTVFDAETQSERKTFYVHFATAKDDAHTSPEEQRFKDEFPVESERAKHTTIMLHKQRFEEESARDIERRRTLFGAIASQQ